MTDRNVFAAIALQAWLSPAYPVGAYAYSHGLEAAFEAGRLHDRISLRNWLNDNLYFGAGRNDAILIGETYRRCAIVEREERLYRLHELAELATALNATGEFRQESLQQGAAFLQVTRKSWPHPDLEAFADVVGPNTAYPVCFSQAAAVHGCALPATAEGYLFASVSNLISAAVRLNILGQTAAQELSASLVPAVTDIARAAQAAGLEDLGGCTFLNDINSFNHEHQNARLFRS